MTLRRHANVCTLTRYTQPRSALQLLLQLDFFARDIGMTVYISSACTSYVFVLSVWHSSNTAARAESCNFEQLCYFSDNVYVLVTVVRRKNDRRTFSSKLTVIPRKKLKTGS